ncbi:MAG: Redoxin domain protein [Frankiales bacterium]|nr:Redoxin domain protein [Frankiales bacterium]
MTITVLTGDSAVTVASEGLLLTRGQLLEATGWDLKDTGLCRGEVCVPVRLTEPVSLVDVAAALRRPLAVEEVEGAVVAVLGESGGQVALTGEVAPPLTLRDVDGNEVALTGTGRKTAVVAWSTWCGCRYELPAWKQLADELRADGLQIITVAVDEDVDAVKPWVQEDLTTAVDPEHRLSDVFGIVNVPSTVWLDEQGRVVKPPTIAPGDDQFIEFTKVDADQHHDALRSWARGGPAPVVDDPADDEAVRQARAERRLAAWLHRHHHLELAEKHFQAAVALAPLDFSIRRSSMPLRGKDPFGPEFFELWEEWSDAGRPGHQLT